MMEEVIQTVARQIPGLAVLVAVVVLFLRAIVRLLEQQEGRDDRFLEALERFRDHERRGIALMSEIKAALEEHRRDVENGEEVGRLIRHLLTQNEVIAAQLSKVADGTTSGTSRRPGP